MWKLFVVVLLTFRAASASGDQEYGPLWSVYARCVQSTVSEIDDMISDATVVARAAIYACSDEHAAMHRKRMGGVSGALWDALNADTLRGDVDHAVLIVLRRRRP